MTPKESDEQPMKLAFALVIAFALICTPSALFAANDAPQTKPTIVFLLIDDLGYADCGFNGGREIRPPNIDQLAASGAVLESHYVQPVCSPTRAASVELYNLASDIGETINLADKEIERVATMQARLAEFLKKRRSVGRACWRHDGMTLRCAANNDCSLAQTIWSHR